MNKTILLGRLTKAPEIRFSQTNNMKVAKFTLAVNRRYTKEGEERQTDFINIVAYSKLAEFIEKYLTQGIQICISGRIQTRNWTDDNQVKHYITEVIAEEIDFADSKKVDYNILNSNSSDNNQTLNNTNVDVITGDNDDLPF